jgi:DNA-binding Xre family transcriptional regulator
MVLSSKGGSYKMKIYIRLQEILNEREMKQKDLSELTNIRTATISEICNNQRSSINRNHLEKIAEKLKIQEIGELMVLIDD